MNIRKKYLTNIKAVIKLAYFLFAISITLLLIGYLRNIYDFILISSALSKIAHYSIATGLIFTLIYLFLSNIHISETNGEIEIRLFLLRIKSFKLLDVKKISINKRSISFTLENSSTVTIPILFLTPENFFSQIRHNTKENLFSLSEVRNLAEKEIESKYFEQFDIIHESIISLWVDYTILFITANLVLSTTLWQLPSIYSLIWTLFSSTFPLIFLIILHTRIKEITILKMRNSTLKQKFFNTYAPIVSIVLWYLISGIIFCQSI